MQNRRSRVCSFGKVPGSRVPMQKLPDFPHYRKPEWNIRFPGIPQRKGHCLWCLNFRCYSQHIGSGRPGTILQTGQGGIHFRRGRT